MAKFIGGRNRSPLDVSIGSSSKITANVLGIVRARRDLVEFAEQMRRRTFAFAKEVVLFCRTLPRDEEGRVVRYQLVKAGTSVGANYRASCRGRSDKEKEAKLGIALEEADECEYWLELLAALNAGNAVKRGTLLDQSREFIRIFATAIATHRANR